MTKRRIDIDDELLTAVQGILGASSQSETVTLALEAVVHRHQRMDFVALLNNGQYDLADPEIMAGAWRSC